MAKTYPHQQANRNPVLNHEAKRLGCEQWGYSLETGLRLSFQQKNIKHKRLWNLTWVPHEISPVSWNIHLCASYKLSCPSIYNFQFSAHALRFICILKMQPFRVYLHWIIGCWWIGQFWRFISIGVWTPWGIFMMKGARIRTWCTKTTPHRWTFRSQFPTVPSWWFQPIWNILVKLDHFPKYHHPDYLTLHQILFLEPSSKKERVGTSDLRGGRSRHQLREVLCRVSRDLLFECVWGDQIQIS